MRALGAEGSGRSPSPLCSFSLAWPTTASLPLVCSYALGMVLWALASDRAHPWTDAAGRLPGIARLVGSVARGERPDLGALRADTLSLPRLRGLIERCWAQDAAARPTAPSIARETEGWSRTFSHAPAPLGRVHAAAAAGDVAALWAALEAGGSTEEAGAVRMMGGERRG